MAENTIVSVDGRIGIENFITEIHTIDHNIFLDEPTSIGGQNKGMKPSEALAASLAGCTLITLKMYLNHKGIDLGEMKIHIEMEQIKKGTDLVVEMLRTITINKKIDQELEQKLIYISDVCPISKILKSSNNIIRTEIKQIEA